VGRCEWAAARWMRGAAGGGYDDGRRVVEDPDDSAAVVTGRLNIGLLYVWVVVPRRVAQIGFLAWLALISGLSPAM